MQMGRGIANCNKVVEGARFNAPPIDIKFKLMPGGGGCSGPEPSTWLRAPLTSTCRLYAPVVGLYHPIRVVVHFYCFTNALVENGVRLI
jgi:hypothetical protein